MKRNKVIAISALTVFLLYGIGAAAQHSQGSSEHVGSQSWVQMAPRMGPMGSMMSEGMMSGGMMGHGMNPAMLGQNAMTLHQGMQESMIRPMHRNHQFTGHPGLLEKMHEEMTKSGKTMWEYMQSCFKAWNTEKPGSTT